MCASVHLEAWDVALYDFLLGCGIRAQRTRPGDADAGWWRITTARGTTLPALWCDPFAAPCGVKSIAPMDT